MYPAAITPTGGAGPPPAFFDCTANTAARGEDPPRAPPDQAALRWITFISATARESGSTFNRR
jgi:hypothetical protein